MTTTIELVQLPDYAGKDLGASEWHEVPQERVNQFAEATGDDQWIHVDVERAEKESPFGGPIAHGYLTLGLLVPMWFELVDVTDAERIVNYGLNKVRFPAPVPVGARVRLQAELADVKDLDGGYQLTIAATIECDQADKPVCVAEPVFRYYR